ncbi:MAG TPA: CoA transferase [Dehalococcoidia bacterium]
MNERAEAWLPLRGVRVLDFTWMIAGPLGTRLLANFGADLIKVESYNRVDRIRETGPHPDGPWSYNEDGSFNDVNMGKRSLLLNLNLPRAQALAKQLAAVSDVVMANFTGDRLDRWGLGFNDLARVRPDIIMLNMPVFESQGERRRWGAIGTHINGLAGISSISGYEGDPPFGLGPLYPDFSGNPFHATSAIIAALIERDHGAGAQFIEVSQYESTASLLGPALLQYAVAGTEPPRRGSRSDRACPHNVYPATGDDRWIAIAVESGAEWAALCRVFGHEEWHADPRFVTLAARFEHEDALDALIAAETVHQPAAQLAVRLQAAGVSAAPVNRLDDVLADPWYRREYFYEQRGPEGCLFTTAGEPIRPFGHQQPAVRAPLMGEHTDAILHELLGIDAAETDELYAAGVLN